MEKYVLYDRVKALCEERGITINKLETELGFSVCSIQKWKAPGAPKVDRIAAVAGYFGVSIDYLMGASDIRSKAEELAENNDFIVGAHVLRGPGALPVHFEGRLRLRLPGGQKVKWSGSPWPPTGRRRSTSTLTGSGSP